ncbi:hypothetical protein F5B22DRAFT_550285 [Xylaria bambusicola]|uniref:uncharacterized protein n=1 Tax=Xylaria bambusicola TaxID=326684 RepID=UPI002007A90F|nr:uncharacterized protein F5B22DRAFT_550285 [Xylaria bambusicola]KAI0503434.1 hypothetical protein F5B22DRAFT_550285 [Xylaria bambusicola]
MHGIEMDVAQKRRRGGVQRHKPRKVACCLSLPALAGHSHCLIGLAPCCVDLPGGWHMFGVLESGVLSGVWNRLYKPPQFPSIIPTSRFDYQLSNTTLNRSIYISAPIYPSTVFQDQDQNHKSAKMKGDCSCSGGEGCKHRPPLSLSPSPLLFPSPLLCHGAYPAIIISDCMPAANLNCYNRHMRLWLLLRQISS